MPLAVRNRTSRLKLVVWLAVGLQLHLLLVTILHHHDLTLGSARLSRATSVSSFVQNSESDSSPLCVACHIARQGSILLGHASTIRRTSPRVRVTPIVAGARYVSLVLLVTSGRDPPRS